MQHGLDLVLQKMFMQRPAASVSFLQKPCSLCAAGFFFVLRQCVMVMMAVSLQKMLDVKKLHRV